LLIPLYRFHIRDASGLIEDEEGTNLPDLASAFRHALDSAREFSAEAPPPANMLFEIADSTGRTVLTVPICDLAASKRPIAKAHVHRTTHSQSRRSE
jgi:hypothetical protein